MSGTKYPGPTGENTTSISLFYRLSGRYLEQISDNPDHPVFLTDDKRPALVILSEAFYLELGGRVVGIEPLKTVDDFLRHFGVLRRQLERKKLDAVAILRGGQLKALMITVELYARLTRTKLPTLESPGRVITDMKNLTRKVTDLCRGLDERYHEILVLHYQRPRAVIISPNLFHHYRPGFQWPEAQSLSVGEINKGLRPAMEKLDDQGMLLIKRYGKPMGVLLKPGRLEELVETYQRALTLRLSWTQFAINATAVFRELARRGRSWGVVSGPGGEITALAIPLSSLEGLEPEQISQMPTVAASALNQQSGAQLRQLKGMGALMVERHQELVGAVMTPDRFSELFEADLAEIAEAETSPWENPNLPELPTDLPEENELHRVLTEALSFFQSPEGELLPEQIEEFWERLRDIYPEIVAGAETIGGQLKDPRQVLQTVGSFLAATLFSLPHGAIETENEVLPSEPDLPPIEAGEVRLDPGRKQAWFGQIPLGITDRKSVV